MVMESTEAAEAAVASLGGEVPPEGVRALVEQAFAAARLLYSDGRSDRALRLMCELRDRLTLLGDRTQLRRAHTMCGLMAADTGDVVGGIDHYVRALRMAIADDDRAAINVIWGNIGMAMSICGNHENAVRCYRRALEVIADCPEGRR